MKQSEFLHPLLPLAQKAGEAFRINPVVILAQAAIGKHSKKYPLPRLGFDCSFALTITITP